MCIYYFQLYWVATRWVSLPYCYCVIIVNEHICIFIDCTIMGLSLSIRVKIIGTVLI